MKNSRSTQLSMKIFLLIYVKMPTIVGILTFMSRNRWHVNFYEQENNILGLSEPEKRLNFLIYEHLKSHA